MVRQEWTLVEGQRQFCPTGCSGSEPPPTGRTKGTGTRPTRACRSRAEKIRPTREQDLSFRRQVDYRNSRLKAIPPWIRKLRAGEDLPPRPKIQVCSRARASVAQPALSPLG